MGCFGMNIGVYAHLQTSTFFRDTIATSCCLYWLTACDRSIFMLSLPHNYIESGQTFFKIVLRSGKISSSVFFSRAIQGLNPEWSWLQKTLAGWHRLPNTIPNTWHWLLLFGRWVPASCYRSESFPTLQGELQFYSLKEGFTGKAVKFRDELRRTYLVSWRLQAKHFDVHFTLYQL